MSAHFFVSVGTWFLFQLDSLSLFFGQQICTAHIPSFGLSYKLIGFLVFFDTSSHLSGTFLTPTEMRLVVVFADGLFFGVHIVEYIHYKQQHWKGTKRCIAGTFATIFQGYNKIKIDQLDLHHHVCHVQYRSKVIYHPLATRESRLLSRDETLVSSRESLKKL